MSGLNKSDKYNIGVITYPFQNILGAAATISSNFIDILEPISGELFVITGKFSDRSNKRIHVLRIKADEKRESMLIRIPKYLITQIRISYTLIKIRKNVDVVFLFLGARTYLLPMLLLKLLKKKTVVIAAASSVAIVKIQYDERFFGMGGFIFSHILGILENLNYTLSDRIIVYSRNLIDQFKLKKHRNKISIAYEHFLDFDKFKIKKKFDERDTLVGYIGRLSGEKGVFDFVKATPEILTEEYDLEFLIGGDGPLCDKIKKYLDENNLNGKVKLMGWINHDRLPDYLNELKLLILPSYTEGLPNIMLEAMACGTPVLATSVGAIPDVIKDGETGFIMENNSPECITESVMRAMEHPDLERIVENARVLVEREFTYAAAVERYRKILEEL